MGPPTMSRRPPPRSLDIRKLTTDERAELLTALHRMVAREELKLGEVLRVLRAAHLRIDRDRFARMVRLSPRAIAELESGRANPTLQTLDQVLRPFGLRIGLVPAPGTLPAEQPPDLTEDCYAELCVEIRAAVQRHSRRSGGA